MPAQSVKNSTRTNPMKPIPILAAAIALSIGSHATARIGETPAEIITRYGPAVTSIPDASGGPATTIHHKGGFAVIVFHHDGRCGTLIVSRLDDDAGIRPALSDAHIQKILRANAPRGTAWEELPATTSPTRTDPSGDPAITRRWRTADGLLEASYATDIRTLTLVLTAAKRANQAATAAQDRAELEGF